MKHGESAECDFVCSGNTEQVCGGQWAMTVYEYAQPEPVPTYAELGCFSDAANNRVMHYVTKSPEMTAEVGREGKQKGCRDKSG